MQSEPPNRHPLPTPVKRPLQLRVIQLVQAHSRRSACPPRHNLSLRHLLASPPRARSRAQPPPRGTSGAGSSLSPPPPSAEHGTSPGTAPSAATPSGLRPHGHLRLWSPCRHHLWLPHPGHDLWRVSPPQSRLRQRPRLPRASRSLHRSLGWHRHAHLRALRQLVARRLRHRRQDRQPAPHPAHPRHPRRRNRCSLPHPPPR